MDTAVGKISVHTIDLCQICRSAYRTYIHLQFLMATVITVSQRKVYGAPAKEAVLKSIEAAEKEIERLEEGQNL